jgi:hypothetical protein
MAKKGKAVYRVTNWKKYNESLVRRGDITLWFAEDVLAAWEHANGEVKVGRPFTYSDTAIECLLALRELFQLPYRQTEGLGRSLVKLMQVEVAIPDFTSLAKRAAKLKVSPECWRGRSTSSWTARESRSLGLGNGDRTLTASPSEGRGASCIYR